MRRQIEMRKADTLGWMNRISLHAQVTTTNHEACSSQNRIHTIRIGEKMFRNENTYIAEDSNKYNSKTKGLRTVLVPIY